MEVVRRNVRACGGVAGFAVEVRVSVPEALMPLPAMWKFSVVIEALAEGERRRQAVAVTSNMVASKECRRIRLLRFMILCNLEESPP